MKDKLFFFGAVDPQWERTTLRRAGGFPLQSLGRRRSGPADRALRGKATYQAAHGQRIDASFFGDPAHGDNGPQRYTALLRTDTSGFSELQKYGGHNQTVKYEGALGTHWLIEGSFARAANDIVEVPSVDAWSVTDARSRPTSIPAASASSKSATAA